MSAARAAVAGLLVLVAVVLQVSFFPHLAWDGVVPDLALLVVVGAALVQGPQFAASLGFVAGVLLDLAPPADHAAGRWALALVLVGWVAGQVRQELRPSVPFVLSTVAVCSLLGTTVFALSGVLVGDGGIGLAEMVQVVTIALVWDVVLGALVLPATMLLLRRLSPASLAW